jgi:Vault protein inter-alpha-trypsin.
MNDNKSKPGGKSWLARARQSSAAIFIGSVLFPAGVIAFEALMGMCADIGFDPFSNTLMLALVSLVPVCNFAVWLIVVKGINGAPGGQDASSGAALKTCSALLGASITISLVYTLAMLPLIVLGAIILVLFFWLHGIGFAGLLPMAPLFALTNAFKMRARLRGQLAARGVAGKRAFRLGILFAAAFFAASFGRDIPTYCGMKLYSASDFDTRMRGLKMLRRHGNEKILRKFCGWRDDVVTYAYSAFEPRMNRADAADLYWRVTGESWFEARSESTYIQSVMNRQITRNSRDVISMEDSFYEWRHDDASATAYAEWTIVLKNTHRFNQEATMRIALPPGAVVSRLTLWVNGEPHEAAFGGRGQAREAYEKVVVRNRDPVLVETCGPGLIRVQCFPVPPGGGTMKFRIGIAAPLAVSESGALGELRAPAILERNFSLAPALQLPESAAIALRRVPAPESFALGTPASETDVIAQTAALAEIAPPARAAIVVDGSLSMREKAGDILRALGSLPDGLPVSLWIADDSDIAPAPALEFADASDPQARRKLQAALAAANFSGGRGSVRTLLAAHKWAEAVATPSGGRGVLLWVHGKQGPLSEPAEELASRIKRSEVRLLLLQASEGICHICAKFDEAPSAGILPHREGMDDIAAALAQTFESWTPGRKEWRFARRQLSPEEAAAARSQPSAEPAAREVAQLWAAGRVLALLASGDPKKAQEAREFAPAQCIVTPASSAVVLEAQNQYKEAGLEQVDAETVPVVAPEPEEWALLILGLAVLIGYSRMRKRNALKSA